MLRNNCNAMQFLPIIEIFTFAIKFGKLMLRDLPIQKINILGIETMQEGVKNADIEPTQLSTKPVTGTLVYAPLHSSFLTLGNISGDIRICGPLSETDITFGVLLKKRGRNFQWSIEGYEGDISVYPPGYSHESLFENNCKYATFAIPIEKIQEVSELCEFNLSDKKLLAAGSHTPPQSLSRGLIRTLLSIDELSNSNPTALNVGAIRANIQDQLATEIVSAIDQTILTKVHHETIFRNSYSLVRRAEEYLRERFYEPVPLVEICLQLGVSLRGLYRAFNTAVGIPPGLYIRLWRLSQVKRKLLISQPHSCTVTEIAYEFGFWELGRFSQHYKGIFGEFPSDTLKTQL